MISFLEFLQESSSPGPLGEDEYPLRDMKGWMSPEGKPHIFSFRQEHAEQFHPDFKFTGRVTDPIKEHHTQGFTRFGTQGDYGHYIHYDPASKGGQKSATHALNFLDIKTGDHIHVNKNIGYWRDSGNLVTKKKSTAMEFIKKK